MLATSIRPPTVDEIRKQTEADIAIMTALAYVLKDRLEDYVDIDPYTLPDPFGENDDYNYSIVIDRKKPERIVAMIASKKDPPLPQLPWSLILGERLTRLTVSKEEARELKSELMPKLTNNFYPYRRAGRIVGFIMFAFQICGRH